MKRSSLPKAEWPWPHFSKAELSCNCACTHMGGFCAGDYFHDPELLTKLEQLRAAIKKPLVITSAHRCRQRNALIGGAPLSLHMKMAVDISLIGHSNRALLKHVNKIGFSGVGLARNFIHLDCRSQYGRPPAFWVYKGANKIWNL